MSDSATHHTAHRGFFPLVAGDNVEVRQAGGYAYFAAEDLSISRGGGTFMVAGRDVSIEQGGANVIVSAGDVSITQGGGGMIAAGSVKAEGGFIGVALGGSVELRDSKVLMTPPQAAALGAGLALTGFLLKKLFGS